MNIDQINLLKESYMTEATKPDGKPGTRGEYMRFLLDGGIDFVTSKDCVVFDDTNELLHCMCINDDARTQCDYPVKLISSEYGMVQQVESIMSQKNFEAFLEEGFISSMISDEKKEFIKKWSQNIKNQALQPMDPEPAYEDTTHKNIIPMTSTKLNKEKYVAASLFAVDASGNKVFYKSIEEAFENLEDGGRLTLVNSVYLTDTVSISNGKKATIELNGNDIIKNNDGALFELTDGELNIINSNNTKCGIISTNGDAFYVSAVDTGKRPVLNIGTGIVIQSNECCILAKGTLEVNTEADLTAFGSKYSAIQGNGSAKNAGTVININGGTITAPNVHAIYHPQNGILNINNANIEGTTALYVKSGTVTIEGSRLSGTGDKGNYVFNGSGACDTGDAIVFDFCDYPGSNPTASIKNSVIKSENGLSIGVYNKAGDINPAEADDAIIIDDNVAINNVEVSKYCKDGVTVYFNKENSDGVNFLTDVVKENSIGLSMPDGTVKSFNSISDAISEATDGSQIAIATGSVFTDTIDMNSGADISIDFGTGDIYSTADTFLNITNGSITLEGEGTIVSEGIGVRVNGEADGASSALIIDSGVELMSKSSTPVFPTGNATVTIKGSLTANGGYAGIQGNGSKGRGGTTIIVDGGTITSDDVAIYNPQIGNVVIYDGKLVGKSGVYIKSGSLTVNGGYIEAVGDATPYAFNGNGCDATGDGIIADFCDYPGGMPIVAITGGVIVSKNAKAFEAYAKDGSTNPEGAKDNINISGGSFSTCPSTEYLAEGYKIEHDSSTSLYNAIKA